MALALAKEQAANPMAGTWTKATKVRRTFTSGRKRKKDLVLSPLRAILEGYISLHEAQSAMVDAGLSEEDVRASLLLVSPDGENDRVFIATLPPVEELPDVIKAVKAHAGEWFPLGMVMFQRDAELAQPDDPDSGWIGWVQPWLTGPRAVRAFEAALSKLKKGKSGMQHFS